MSIRPSSLPKLEICPRFESAPGTSEQAARGTRIDRIFRDLLGGQSIMPEACETGELEAARWAVRVASEILEVDEIETREDKLRVHINLGEIEMKGTMDACQKPGDDVREVVFFDIKSGQVRDYRAQMAAYALGLMQERIADRATAHLLFCDEQRVVVHRFTREDCEEMLEPIVKAASDPKSQPVLCDYCGWCARQTSCEARLQAVAVAESEVATLPADFKLRLKDPDFVGRFLTACAVVEDFQELAKERAKEIFEEGGTVPGWSMSSRKGLEFVKASDLVTAGISKADIITEVSNLSGKKARAIWERSMPGTPFPEEICETGASARVLRAEKPNKKTK